MTGERRTLIDGLKETPPPIDHSREKDFVYSEKSKAPQRATPTTPTVNRVPLSTRIRADYSAALKRASLERQLKAVEPNSLQDILEEAIEPWLRSNGYIT
jgi:hypothetical protein